MLLFSRFDCGLGLLKDGGVFSAPNAKVTQRKGYAMTIENVTERLDALLSSDRAKVILLTGGWGAGKTYQWKQALQRAGAAANRPRYAYVSLFGLVSLAEVRKRVAEETVAAINLPDNAGTVGETIENGGWQWKPLQIIKLLPIIPYLNKLEGLANELSFLSVRNAVICFDDLERAGASLRIADIFGLASFLKEERNCRVVLISNQEKLDTNGKKDLSLYLEKVVDETMHFAPTSDEACRIAFGESPDLARVILRERIVTLGISNIRVISRLSSLAAELALILEGLHANVLKEGIRTLVLFGAAQFLPTDGFPQVDWLMKLGNDWSRYFRDAKKAEGQTDEDRKLEAWYALLERYGYVSTFPFDVEIACAVQRGYFDRGTLVPLAQELSTSSESHAMIVEYQNAWSRFWHSLDGDGGQLLRELREVTIRAIGVIGPDDMQTAFEVFRQAGHPEVGTELLDLFIASNQHRPGVFGQSDGPFREMYKGEFAERLRLENERHKTPPTIEEALDRIDFDRGWNPEDIRVVGKANLSEIERLLRTSEGHRFRTRLRTLLRVGTLADAKEDEKRVSEQALELLKTLAREDPIMAIRMRQYIPAEGAGEKP